MNQTILRNLLHRDDSLHAICTASTAGDLNEMLPMLVTQHIADVYQRLETVAEGEFAEVPALRLAVLVHEESPIALPALLEKAGFPDLAPLVVDIVMTFGQVWKLKSKEDMAEYVRDHRQHLAATLLFELAHEGRSTPAMEEAARLGGLDHSFARWAGRLPARFLTPVDVTLAQIDMGTRGFTARKAARKASCEVPFPHTDVVAVRPNS